MKDKYIGKKVSFDFQDADILPIFRLLSEISGYNIFVNPEVKGKISMKLINVPWEQALDLILKTHSIGMVIEGNIIRVAPLDVLAKEKEAEAKAKLAVRKAESLVTKVFPIKYAEVAIVEKSIKELKILSSRGSIIVDKRTSSMIIKDVPALFPQIETLVATLDKPTHFFDIPKRESNNSASHTDKVFICHASEDKESFVRPLAQELLNKGFNVWYDEFSLTVGDSLRRSIDRGLAKSRFGVVVLSHSFFEKEWPQRELDGLTAREINGVKVILPVWHNVNREEVMRYSPVLADRVGVLTSKGLDHVVSELLKVIDSHL